MKRFFLNLVIALASTIAMAQSDYPAFPGAEGHGRYVAGGRGGEIRHVTNLNDSGEGSLRAAVNGSTAKIVVFDVGGVIALESDLKIGNNTTILGQTAPDPGITIRYYTVRPTANNVIRFIRIRRGEEKDVDDGADALWQRQVTGMMIDHCSFSWSIDEVASFYDNNNFTMQWCTIAEALNNAGHGKGAHSYGGIWGGKLASFHHNYLAHMANRVPRFNGARYTWTGYTKNYLYDEYEWENPIQSEHVDFRNCVMFNWGSGSCYGGPGGGHINIVNNYYKGGPSTSKPNRVTQVSVGSSSNSTDAAYRGMTSRYYVYGNTTETAAGVVTTYRDWDGVEYDGTTYTIDGERYTLDSCYYYGTDVEHVENSKGYMCVKIKLDEPTYTGEVTTHSAENAYEKVLAYCGASLYRDEVDERYMTETETGEVTYVGSVTGSYGLIDVVADVNGYTEETFGTGAREDGWDTDNDGIPDDWENANGMNPNDSTDAYEYTVDTKGYYCNLEVYANSLVQEIMLGGNEDAEDSVADYYPAYYKADGTYVEAVNGSASGISSITVAGSTNGQRYNLQGQKVDSSYKGLIILNGRKYINR